MTKESTRNKQRRQRIDKLTEKNLRNIVRKHLAVNSKTNEEVDKNNMNVIMDLSSDNDDIPLSQRYKKLRTITLRSSRLGKKIHTCAICNIIFDCKSKLEIHMTLHNDSTLYRCDVCSKSFKTHSNMMRHMEFYCEPKQIYTCESKSHEKLHEMKYICEQCGMEFKRRYGLTKHMRTHSAEKKCLCAVCGKTFKSLSAQKVHLLTHVGERPYVCDLCGKSFTQRSPMMLHRRTKHPEITVAPPPIKITGLLHGVKDKIITNQVLN